VEQLDCRFGGAAVDRDPDVGLERERDTALHSERLVQCAQQPLGHQGRVRCAVEVVEQGAELVVAEPGQGVPRTDQVLEPRGDLDQQPVAGRLAHPLLDRGDRPG
jgi:hypothetical protein